MYFDSVQAALYMDGHGVFVWMSYFVTITMLIVVVVAPMVRRRRFLTQLSAQLKRAQGPGHNTVKGAR